LGVPGFWRRTLRGNITMRMLSATQHAKSRHEWIRSLSCRSPWDMWAMKMEKMRWWLRCSSDLDDES
jgi:hypothetical protein